MFLNDIYNEKKELNALKEKLLLLEKIKSNVSEEIYLLEKRCIYDEIVSCEKRISDIKSSEKKKIYNATYYAAFGINTINDVLKKRK